MINLKKRMCWLNVTIVRYTGGSNQTVVASFTDYEGVVHEVEGKQTYFTNDWINEHTSLPQPGTLGCFVDWSTTTRDSPQVRLNLDQSPVLVREPTVAVRRSDLRVPMEGWINVCVERLIDQDDVLVSFADSDEDHYTFKLPARYFGIEGPQCLPMQSEMECVLIDLDDSSQQVRVEIDEPLALTANGQSVFYVPRNSVKFCSWNR